MTADILIDLLQANLFGGLVIVLVLAVRRPARRAFGPGLAYALWLAPIVAMLAALLPAMVREIPLAVAFTPSALQAPLVQVIAAAPPASTAVGAGGISSTAGLVALWLIGVGASLLLTSLNQRRAMKGFGRLNAEAPSLLRASREGCGPAVIGLFRPRLVLPLDFERRYTPGEQAMILTHERTHLASGHVWLNTAAVLIGAVNWFNPLVHLAIHFARLDQELACDAAVVERFPGERRTYARAMLKSQLAGAPLPLGCAWPARSNPMLKERIEMLALERPKPGHRLIGALAITVLGVSAGFAAWAAQPPEIRSVLVPAAAAGTPTPTPAPRTASARTPAPIAARTAAPAAEAEAPALPQTICLSNACDDAAAGPGELTDRTAAGRERMRRFMDAALASAADEQMKNIPKTVAEAVANGDPNGVQVLGGTLQEMLTATVNAARQAGEPGMLASAERALAALPPEMASQRAPAPFPLPRSFADLERTAEASRAQLQQLGISPEDLERATMTGEGPLEFTLTPSGQLVRIAR